MGGIHRPIQGLRHLQSRTTHCHTMKRWRPPKNTISDQTYVRQKYSQAHHRKGGDIHWIQSGCQTMTQYVPSTIYVLNDGLLRYTRRWVDGPQNKQSPICAQRQLTKINPTISEPSTRHLLVWNTIWSILHALCRLRRIYFRIQDWHRKKDHPTFQPLCSVQNWNAHRNRKNPSKTECLFLLPPGFFNTQTIPLISLTTPTLSLQNKESEKRDAHVRTKNMPIAMKQKLSR